MDDATIHFITSQNTQLKEDLKDIILANGTVIRGKIVSEIDRIDELDKRRNSRIEKAEDNIVLIKKETRISRWAHRNPKLALITFVILVAGVATGLHTINVKRTIEKVMKIEFNETTIE